MGGAALGLAEPVTPLVAGALAVALELALTGALHADGLADSADGLGGRDREHALAIMRDHIVLAAAIAAAAFPLALAAAFVVTAAVWWLARRRLGGVTGDVLGAAIELSATAALVVAAASR